jgi:hypothetical protein
MRNLDISDTRAKLLTYVRAGIIAPWSGTALPAPAGGDAHAATPASAPHDDEPDRGE